MGSRRRSGTGFKSKVTKKMFEPMVAFLAADLGSAWLVGTVVVAALFALLVVAALVSQNLLYQVHVRDFINLNLQLDILLVCLTQYNLERLMHHHGLWTTERLKYS